MEDKQFYGFYRWVFSVPLLPYICATFPSLPQTVGPFVVTGVAWVIMLAVTLYYLFALPLKGRFPIKFWLPWTLFLAVYLCIDFSFYGLQLTLQYILPVMIGITSSGFTYTTKRLEWMYKSLVRVTVVIGILFTFRYLLMGGAAPMAGTTPMFLTVVAALTIGIFYQTKKTQFLMGYVCISIIPLILMTRMGIAAMLIIFIFHFANRGITSRITVGLIGILAIWAIFNSKGFQEKTFKGGNGNVSELSINYYDPGESMNTSGRAGFLEYYEKGLSNAPLLGNGPRSDLYIMKDLWGGNVASEAHNDYIAVRYNYGYIGLGLLLFGFAMTFFSTYVQLLKELDAYKSLVQSSVLVLTVAFLVYMYSDNILKTTVFFTNLYFILIGLAYAKFDTKQGAIR
ncbi:MAG: hypothetical protein HGB02_00110 [Chlorobiaceae bacterium]|nr:hypothetical protein [Chlorobiaceae bacterium]